MKRRAGRHPGSVHPPAESASLDTTPPHSRGPHPPDQGTGHTCSQAPPAVASATLPSTLPCTVSHWAASARRYKAAKAEVAEIEADLLVLERSLATLGQQEAAALAQLDAVERERGVAGYATTQVPRAGPLQRCLPL